MRDDVVILLEWKRLVTSSIVFTILKTDISFTVDGAALEHHSYKFYE